MDKVEITKEDIEREVESVHSKGMIIATLGKACKHPETLIKMIDAGMNVVRLRLCQEQRKKQVIMLDYLKEAFTHKPHK